MIWKRFNRWVVVAQGQDYVYPTSQKTSVRMLCLCDCGITKLVHKSHLLNGTSQSCGCLNREISSTHGMSKTRAYKSWANMIIRCSNPADNEETYRQRGISCAPEWKDFEVFYRDMGDCPDGFELERSDSFGDYCKSNCSWASETTQSANRATFKNNTSGRTGVTWSEQHNKWRTGIYVNKTRYEGGLYENFEDACAARDALEVRFYGAVKSY